MYFEVHRVMSDRQGRITLPRTLFKTGRITRGGSLCLYPIEQYWIARDVQRIQEIMLKNFPGSALDPDVRDVRRNFFSDVKSLHIDPQGRVQFHDTAGAEYVVIGAGQEFEIWPHAVWQKQHAGGNDGEG
ncbi:division/cell wall cluster transcriptional repressor MraZ [bacterium]|nr:division/cell wall cluster transcriptional repressor MraZ [bacterium]